MSDKSEALRILRYWRELEKWAAENGLHRREYACLCWLRGKNCRNQCPQGGLFDHLSGWLGSSTVRGRNRNQQAVLVSFPYWTVEMVEEEIDNLGLRNEFRIVIMPPPGLWHPWTCRVEFWRQ